MEGSIDFCPTASSTSISSYRPLGDVIIARDEMSRNDCQLHPRYLSGILIESIDFFSTTCNSIVEIVYIFPGFVEECSVFVAAFNNCLCVFYFLIEYLEIIDLLSFTRIRIWNLEMFRIKIEVVLESINKLITRFIHSQRRYNFLNQSKIKIEKTYSHET